MSAETIALRQFATTDADFEAAFAGVLRPSEAADAAIDAAAAAILADVRTRGDAAVLEYTRRFDRLDAPSVAALEIGRSELQQSLAAITPAQRAALESAAERLRIFHERQLEVSGRSWSYRDADDSLLGQKVTPLDRVGIYVPGGKAAYPSSVLMNAIPAKVAGVGEIVMVVPTPAAVPAGATAARGERNPLVLAAAAIAGVDRVVTIGGAQAVGALAYGTATIRAVDKITGPGNAYVAAAKRRVFGLVGIDMIAGPSEILVLADGSTPADWVAMDLFSQAEHDELAQSILLCPDAGYLSRVREAIERLLPTMPRSAVIRASLEGRGALIHTRSMEEACEISNRIAPEHLEVSARDPGRWEPLLRHAGAIFLGAYTSESLGDYCAGPNHVLPTAGTARFSSPLGVYDFQKRSSIIEVSERGARVLGPIAAELAFGEGLHAHAQAALLRMPELPEGAATVGESGRPAANATSAAAASGASAGGAGPEADGGAAAGDSADGGGGGK
ncbi:histidinol dehydrogenase [Piscinibacter koreensis]|uniref:Histidinol dehydrogenase n=1 Tax=Piscinibacter koreensis TaxID=2742824 RepID=A0A7Y6NP11_9BURK|nr:histidinol dehydrogenase [Schlegelella koreensis]NUZ06654.1 histidinol dehydrogenase [Schlegelella koreensis]